MKGMIFAAVFAACALAAPVQAATSSTPAKTLTPQQQKMKDCNAQAKTKALKGDDRKAFMKTCLSGSSSAAAPAAAATPAAAAPAAATPAAAAPAAPATPAAADAGAASSAKPSQTQKMKDCNAQATAKSLKGDDRKTFMSTCLKG